MRRRHGHALAALMAALSLVAGACSSSDSGPVVTSTIALAVSEVEFAQGMIAHHEQAIEMAEMALDPAAGAGPEVIALATRIRDGQDPEIEVMSGWLTMGGHPIIMDMSDGHDMAAMHGMMSQDEMMSLGDSTDTDFDRLWLELMIEHHEGAIVQSNDIKATAQRVDVLALADQIVVVQQAEIAEMKALLGG